MDNKNAKLRALAQLRKLVGELMDEDFTTNRMPKLSALKVKVEEKPMEMEVHSDESMESKLPVCCKVCGEEDCMDHENPEMTEEVSDEEAPEVEVSEMVEEPEMEVIEAKPVAVVKKVEVLAPSKDDNVSKLKKLLATR